MDSIPTKEAIALPNKHLDNPTLGQHRKCFRLSFNHLHPNLLSTNLGRLGGEVEAQLRDQVLSLVLACEKLERTLVGVRWRSLPEGESQLASHRQQVAAIEASYRTGEGSTPQMIQRWQRTEDIEARIRETEISQSQTYRALLELTGYETETSD